MYIKFPIFVKAGTYKKQAHITYMKLAIIGSRKIQDFALSLVVPTSTAEIISGGAKGVDTIARRFAEERGIKLTEFLPEYSKYGKSAPIIRNKMIVNNADAVLAIWDGSSKGTAFTIDFAKKQGKQVIIVNP